MLHDISCHSQITLAFYKRQKTESEKKIRLWAEVDYDFTKYFLLQPKYFYWWESSHKVLTVNKLLFPRLMCFLVSLVLLTTPLLNKTHNLFYENVVKDQRQHWTINQLISEPGLEQKPQVYNGLICWKLMLYCTPSLSTMPCFMFDICIFYKIETFVWWSWLEWSGL